MQNTISSKDEPMDRNEKIKAERRRRNTSALEGKRRRLALDESKLDRQNFVYRWANDEGNRIHALTAQDDWEVVQDRAGDMRPDSAAEGAQVAVHAMTGEKGASVRAVLLRKPKAYYDEDFAVSQRQIDDTEASLRQKPSGPGGDENTYIPDTGITVARG